MLKGQLLRTPRNMADVDQNENSNVEDEAAEEVVDSGDLVRKVTGLALTAETLATTDDTANQQQPLDADRTEDQVTELLDDDRIVDVMTTIAEQSAPSLDDVANIPDDTSFAQGTEEATVKKISTGLKQLEVKLELGLKELEIQFEESSASEAAPSISVSGSAPIDQPAIAQGELALPEEQSQLTSASQSVEAKSEDPVSEFEAQLEKLESTTEENVQSIATTAEETETSTQELVEKKSSTVTSATLDEPSVEVMKKVSQVTVSRKTTETSESEPIVTETEEVVKKVSVIPLGVDKPEESILSEVSIVSETTIETEKSEKVETQSVEEPVPEKKVSVVQAVEEPSKKVSFAQEEAAQKKLSVAQSKVSRQEVSVEEVAPKKASVAAKPEEPPKKSSVAAKPADPEEPVKKSSVVAKKLSKQEEPAKKASVVDSELAIKKPSFAATKKASAVVAPEPTIKEEIAAEPLPPQRELLQQEEAAPPFDERPKSEAVEEPAAPVEPAPPAAEGGYVDLSQHKERVASGFVSVTDHQEPASEASQEETYTRRQVAETAAAPSDAAPRAAAKTSAVRTSDQSRSAYTSSVSYPSGAVGSYYSKPTDTSDVAYKSSYHVPAYVNTFDNYVSIGNFSHNLWSNNYTRQSRSRKRFSRSRDRSRSRETDYSPQRSVERYSSSVSSTTARYLPKSSSYSSLMNYVGAKNYELQRDRSTSQMRDSSFNLSRSSSRTFAPEPDIYGYRETVDNFVKRINEPLAYNYSYKPSMYQRPFYRPTTLGYYSSSYYGRAEPSDYYSGSYNTSRYYPAYEVSPYASAYKPDRFGYGHVDRWQPSYVPSYSRGLGIGSMSPLMTRSGLW